jgi:hypothetical protein
MDRQPRAQPQADNEYYDIRIYTSPFARDHTLYSVLKTRGYDIDRLLSSLENASRPRRSQVVVEARMDGDTARLLDSFGYRILVKAGGEWREYRNGYEDTR